MADALTTRLRKLNDAHDAEVIDDDAYQAGLAKLRLEYGTAPVDTLLQQGAPPTETRTHVQHIREYTSIQAAVAGDVPATSTSSASAPRAPRRCWWATCAGWPASAASS